MHFETISIWAEHPLDVDAEADADADIDFDIATELEVLKRRRNFLDFDAHATCQRIPDKYEICIRIKRDGRKMENSEGRWRRFYTII